ncbi:MAG TPA: Cof-type HAD-IIB family hydrolase [Candidatus Acidoferrales bacterium]|nr:Cof-type HAD-IIB family hydrolase [Candidatus Acidoferrales bacterium]
MTPANPQKPIRLVIADVDGTLVTQEKILTQRAIQSVMALRAADIKFAVTSGRPPRGMAMLIDPLKIDEPLAAFNGGVIIKPDLTTIVRENFLPRAMVEKVIKIILDHKLDVWIYTGHEWYVRDVNAPHVAREQWTVKFPPVVVPGFEGLLENIAKVVGVSDDLEAVQRCEKDTQEACGNQASAARSQPYYLDVTHPKANKGEVVLAMSELLNTPVDQIATIGDMPNDVLMFRKSGISIAMGNASPEVQKAATYVTTSNEEEGFAEAMEKFVLRRRAAN